MSSVARRAAVGREKGESREGTEGGPPVARHLSVAEGEVQTKSPGPSGVTGTPPHTQEVLSLELKQAGCHRGGQEALGQRAQAKRTAPEDKQSKSRQSLGARLGISFVKDSCTDTTDICAT